MRILAISVTTPFPPVGGGPLRTYHLLRALATRHDLTLVGFTYGNHPEEPPFPVRVIAVPWELPPLYRQMQDPDCGIAERAAEVLGNETDQPWFVTYFQSAAMQAALGQVCADEFDLVLIEDADMLQYFPVLPGPTPKILDFHNVYSLLARRAAERQSGQRKNGALKEAKRTLAFERRFASQCDLSIVCSESERSAARMLLELTNVDVVPNGVDTSFFTPSPEIGPAESLLFTGSLSYAPNVEAVKYFVQQILPVIRNEIPSVKFHIAGSNPVREVLDLGSETVVIHANVPDMRPYFADAGVVVVPILSGGGTRLKILEAAASGKAIVTTALGVEGLEFRAGQDLLVADSPAELARAIAQLVRNPEKRRELGSNARAAACRFDWETIGAKLCAVADQFVLQEV